MEKKDSDRIAGWFAGRVPDGWFVEAPSVTVEGEQIRVVGRLAPPEVAADALPELRSGAEAGRIGRFREHTRGHRIAIAREAERQFKLDVTWGAVAGATTTEFTAGGSGRRRGEGSEDQGGPETPRPVEIMARHWARRFASGGFGARRFRGAPWAGDRQTF